MSLRTIFGAFGAPYYNKFSEKNSILFPREGNKLLNRGRWVKITNWDTDNEGGI